jgi:ankyrin repeat protein
MYHTLRSAYLQTSEVAHRSVKQNLPLLLDYGLDLNDLDKEKRTALHTASDALRGHDPDEEALIDLVELLVERGADLEAVDKELGTTPLGWAIRYGRNHLAGWLIEAGSSLDPRGTADGASPRELIEKYGDEEIRKLIDLA